jgi:DNA-binding response OmpR family regulator
MPPARLLVAGLDVRSLVLGAPMLQRDGHRVRELPTLPMLLDQLAAHGAELVVLGTQLGEVRLPDGLRRLRASPATRRVSVLALVPAHSPDELIREAEEAGANIVLRRPVEERVLEAALSRLLVVPRRVDVRIAVEGQVLGSSRGAAPVHFYGLTRNVSVNGMLLASPVRLAGRNELELELMLGARSHLRALGRLVREAPEVAWPYLGYGIEFVSLPKASQERLETLVLEALMEERDPSHGIHCTLRREDWVYEILEPVRQAESWQAEIRRAPREEWRPGATGPLYVVAGRTRDDALTEARRFVAERHVVPRDF